MNEIEKELAEASLLILQRVDELEKVVQRLAEVVAGKQSKVEALGSSRRVSATEFLQLGEGKTSKSIQNAHAIVRKEQEAIDDSWDTFQDSINNSDHRRPATAADVRGAWRS